MHTLFTLEDNYGLKISEMDGEVCLKVDVRKSKDAAQLHEMLCSWQQAELEEFIYNAKILINALGHKAFESYSEEQPNNQDENPVFSVSAGSGKAYGMRTADGFVLLKGSSIHEVSADSLNNGIKKKVEQSRTSGEIKDGILQNDKLFSSSSAAAAFATGYSISGPQQWKNEQGKTLKSFETEST